MPLSILHSVQPLLWTTLSMFMIFNLGHRSLHIFSLQCADTVHIPFLLSIHSLLNELCWGERQGTPWAGCKCIARLTQRDRRSFTPMLNSVSLINVMRRSLDCGRKLEYIKKTHTRQSCPVLCAGSPLHLYWIWGIYSQPEASSISTLALHNAHQQGYIVRMQQLCLSAKKFCDDITVFQVFLNFGLRTYERLHKNNVVLFPCFTHPLLKLSLLVLLKTSHVHEALFENFIKRQFEILKCLLEKASIFVSLIIFY